jgi:hypothetical protein
MYRGEVADTAKTDNGHLDTYSNPGNYVIARTTR